MTDKERIAQVLCAWTFSSEEQGMNYWRGISKTTKDNWLKEADMVLECVKELGYTRQPEYEPVELEALGDEEMIDAIGLNPTKSFWSKEDWDAQITREMRKVSQATIKKNQAKGQLYRVEVIKK